MSDERDELAEVIKGTNLIGCGCCGASTETQVGPDEWDVEYPPRENALAGRILAAGYRKPQQVTTVEELDALPDAVLILTEQGGYWESIKRMDGRNWWKEPGARDVSPSEYLTLPATVLHVGGAA